MNSPVQKTLSPLASRQCWICKESPANSSEHIIQHSDLKAIFGNTPGTPLFLHRQERANIKIQGTNSAQLKFEKVICGRCNDTLTQPHDRAWEKFSDFARKYPFLGGQKIRFNRVFPMNTAQEMRHIHLHFLKKFGCVIAQYEVPLDLEPLSNCILKDQIYPNLFIGFATRPSGLPKDKPYISNLELWKDGTECAFAEWCFMLEKLAVIILYAKENGHSFFKKTLWNPAFNTNRTWMINSDSYRKRD